MKEIAGLYKFFFIVISERESLILSRNKKI